MAQRRATSVTSAPGCVASATIKHFYSSDQLRRRSPRVTTSTTALRVLMCAVVCVLVTSVSASMSASVSQRPTTRPYCRGGSLGGAATTRTIIPPSWAASASQGIVTSPYSTRRFTYSWASPKPMGSPLGGEVKHLRGDGIPAREGVALAFFGRKPNLCTAAKRFAACCFLGRFLPRLGGTLGCRLLFRRDGQGWGIGQARVSVRDGRMRFFGKRC